MPPTHNVAASQPEPRTQLDAATREDDELLRRLADGDRGALAMIYDRHSGAAFTLAHRVCGGRGDDVVEEAFLALWREARAGRGDGAVRSRLLRITMDRSLALLHDGERRGRGSAQAYTIPRRPSAIALVDGDAHVAIDALPENERQCVELAYFDGLSIAEIAARTGLPPGTVSDRLGRGMERLHRILVAGMLTPAAGDGPTFPQ